MPVRGAPPSSAGGGPVPSVAVRGTPPGYRGSSSGGYKKPRKKGASPFGFVGNLFGDVENAVVGLGPGLVRAGSAVATDIADIARDRPYGLVSPAYVYSRLGRGHTREEVLEPVARSYAETYGPLVRGDVGEFAHRFYEHPLGPILDAASVLSFGAAGAAKAGLAPAAVQRGYLELRTPSGALVRKPLPRQTLRAELQVATSQALNRLPAEAPIVGEAARAARQLRKGPLKTARARELEQEPYLRALGKVRNKHQRLAAFWLSQVPLPSDLARLAKLLEEEGSLTALATATMLRDERFLRNYAAPSPRIQSVLEEASHVAEAQRAILGVTEDVARQRAYLPTLLARGATFRRADLPPEGYPTWDDFMAEIRREVDELGVEYPQRLGVEQALISARGGRRNQRVFEPGPRGPDQEVTRPRTPEEAQAQLAKLEQELEERLRPLVDEEFPPAARRREQGMRNVLPHTRSKRAAAGLERELDLYGIGREGSVLADAYERIEAKIIDLAAKPDADPTVKRVAQMIEERDALRRELSDPDVVFGDKIPELGEVTELAPAPGFGSIEDMIRQIDADLEAAGRPKPVYMPHTSERPRAAGIYGVGGSGPQRTPGPLHQTMGVLLSRGQLIQDPRVLQSSYVRSAKYALYRDIHQLHVEHAQRLAHGEPVPAGWQVVRRSHAERTPYTVKTGSEFEEFVKEFLDDEAGFRFEGNPFVTEGTEVLLDEGGYRLIVPKEFSRQLAGEFVKANRFLELLNRYPVRVWRHLVLKLRPAWLAANVVGSSLLYLIDDIGPAALREFGIALKRAFPHKSDAFDRIMRKHFPEQVSGTFIGSQLPVFPATSRLARIERPASFVGAGLAQVDRAWEAALRSGIVRKELRRSPELRAFAGKMRRQSDEFWKVADEELARNPLLAERISDRVNDALGDYLALGRFERDVIRSAFPFYAWFRVISLITFKLPLTHPLKASLLARLGQAGVTSTLEELGLDDDAINYAKAFVPFGPEEQGRVAGLSTASINPFATVGELQEFVAALAAGKPGDAWSVLPGANPLLALPLEVLTGAKPRSGYRGTNRFGLLGTAVDRYVKSIPQVRLGQALTGSIYEGTPSDPTLVDRDRWDEVLRYLGVPYVRLSPSRAAEVGAGR